MQHEPKKNVVVIGGGTGTYSVLSGLKGYADSLNLTAIVAMSDAGGSNAKLRDELGALPVSDVRMALLALSNEVRIDSTSLRELFLYRFTKGKDGLLGHNFGNLLITALSDILGSQLAAIEMVSRMLDLRGKVLPVTTEPIHLVAKYDDCVEVVGEDGIDVPTPERAQHAIIDLSIRPHAALCPGVVSAIMDADLIVLGPGDLYTSLLAAAIVGDLPKVLRDAPGRFIYISNLMSHYGQTTGYDTARYVAEIEKYIGRAPDAMLINTTEFPSDLVERYAESDEYPVVDAGSGNNTTEVVRGDFVSTAEVRTVKGDMLKRSLIRHDARKLADSLMERFIFRV